MGVDGRMEALRFNEGTSDNSYEYLGVHREDTDYVFRVWAPRADTVCVVGDFNAWNDTNQMMLAEGGIWECSIPAENIHEGDLYKYKIKSGERIFYKSDPYAFCAGHPPETASVICDISGYKWRDSGWLSYRRKTSGGYSEPINIYRLHATSWKRHEDGSHYSWSELSTELATYVKQMGYTHIELMPIAEHFLEDSFGYRVDSYYAPNARLGSPQDFMRFVDSMHEAGIGVIMDWIPTHFSKEEYALIEFDGQPLYEYAQESQAGNTRFEARYFDLSKNEVKSFLISNALFWLRVYHIDGLRADNELLITDRDKRNIDETEFFGELEELLRRYFPDVIFSYKSETLGLTLDNSKESLAQIRLSIGHHMTLCGEKLLLMGTEIGQTSKWYDMPPMEWSLLYDDAYALLQYYVAELNHFYLRSPQLWQNAVIADIEQGDVISYRRTDGSNKDLIVVLNFTAAMREGYVIEVGENGSYKTVLSSDEKRFGGNGTIIESLFYSEKGKIKLDIPPLSLLILIREDGEYKDD